jgi:hypothetical protein
MRPQKYGPAWILVPIFVVLFLAYVAWCLVRGSWTPQEDWPPGFSQPSERR